MINEHDKNILNKINFFLNEKIKVHVEKNDKLFLNGYFIKLIKEDVWIFKDDKFKEVYLFLSDIYDVEEYRDIKKEV